MTKHCLNIAWNAHKFGGSILFNASDYRRIASLISGPSIIVVSAINNTTSLLYEIINRTAQKKSYEHLLAKIKISHEKIIEELVEGACRVTLLNQFNDNFNNIKLLLNSIKSLECSGDLLQQQIVGFGELWSAQILNGYLSQKYNSCCLDASKILFTSFGSESFGIDWKKSSNNLKKYLSTNAKCDKIVITGFIASDQNGQRITLGRNGSDFSAAIFAKLFGCKSLTVWKDVDGIFTADPSKVSNAVVIDKLSYDEAAELASLGANVLHPRTILPAVEANIPIYVRNCLKPKIAGTHIVAEYKEQKNIVKCVSSVDNVCMISIQGDDMINKNHITAQVLQVLSEHKISTSIIFQASSRHTISLAIINTEDADVYSILKKHFKFELSKKNIEAIIVDNKCSLVSAVGNNMAGKIGIAEQMFKSLANANVNICAIAQGSLEKNISVVVPQKDCTRALKAVHSGFFLSKQTLSIGLIGAGNVARSLLEQLKQQSTFLKNNYGIELYLSAISNSKKMLIADQNLLLGDPIQNLQNSNTLLEMDLFIDHVKNENIPHSLIIDCSASQDIADKYCDLLSSGVHIITPNKKANTSPISYYNKIKNIENKSVQYLYEATVGAGLPIIKTLKDLIQTGDKIISIEGVFSGTLSYVFNQLSEGVNFAQAVSSAKDKGLTEPDIRDDLSGMDVARKLVILAREMGLKVELDAVEVQNLIPSELSKLSGDHFLRRLKDYSEEIDKIATSARKNNEVIYYTGKVTNDGRMQTKVQCFPSNHPFAKINFTDNIVLFYTERYKIQPLIVQGPGAGPQVTASGIFADILRLATFLGANL